MKRSVIYFLAVAFIPHAIWASTDEYEELWDLSIEELLNTPVVTASKSTQRYFEVPAAVTVLRSSDLENSGFTNIPNALRYVPGMSVGAGNSTMWSIGSRGRTGLYSNKLLVMKDGVSIYSPAFSGVLWDGTHGSMSDIERIEVVRGPGGATWGVNAVNAVINILSKSAFDTIGGKVSVGMGTDTESLLAVRLGHLINEDSAVRISLQHTQLDAGPDGYDDGQLLNGSLRYDLVYGGNKEVMISGEFYDNRNGSRVFVDDLFSYPNHYAESDILHRAQSLVGKWKSTFEQDAITIKTYVRKSTYQSNIAAWDQITYDLDFFGESYRFDNHKITYGTGIRYSEVEGREATGTDWDGRVVDRNIYSVFAEDEVSFFDEKMKVYIGSRLEYFSHLDHHEIEPRLGISYFPDDQTHWWVRASRSIRNPSLGEAEVGRIFGGIYDVDTPLGSSLASVYFQLTENDLKPEKINTFELGYRRQLSELFIFDANFYRSYYYGVVGNVDDEVNITVIPGIPPQMVAEYELYNAKDLRSHGVELSLKYMASENLQFSINYAYLDEYSKGTAAGSTAGKEPKHASQVGITYLSEGKWTAFLGLRYVGETNFTTSQIPECLQADFNIRYSVTENFAVSLTGNGVLDEQYGEYDLNNDVAIPYSEVERNFLIRLDYKF